MRPSDLVGQTICETYVVEEVIGNGTMGVVFKVRHVRLPRRFAMKVLHGDLQEGSEGFARFRREAEITSSLGHPNIVDVVDWNRLPDYTPFLIMEYLQGEDLHTRLQREGTLSLPAALDLMRQVGSALSAAHKQGVVHRDLKPQNIFLCRVDRGEEVVEIAKVLDFGISKIVGGDPGGTFTGAVRVMGTPLYMAPEQAMGFAANVDGRADQWALAAILYHALSGRRPFEGSSIVEIALKVTGEDPPPLAQLCPGLPDSVYYAISRALSKEREQRFASIGDFVRALQAFQGTTGAVPLVLRPSDSVPMAVALPAEPRPTPPAQKRLTSESIAAVGVAGTLLATGPGGLAATPAGWGTSPAPVLTSAPLLSRGTQSLLILIFLTTITGLFTFWLTRTVGRMLLPRHAVVVVPPPPPLPKPPPEVRPPVVPKVTLSFTVTPLAAEVYLDGKRVTGPVTVPRSEIGLHLEVRAPGYTPQTEMVVPTSDHRIIVRLSRKSRRGGALVSPW